MRLFIAINIPEKLQRDLKDALEPVESAARATNAKARWVNSSQFHLTIQFLGEVPEEQLPRLKKALQEALSDARRRVVMSAGTQLPRVAGLRSAARASEGAPRGIAALRGFTVVIGVKMYRSAYLRIRAAAVVCRQPRQIAG